VTKALSAEGAALSLSLPRWGAPYWEPLARKPKSGSELVDQSQKITVTAKACADMTRQVSDRSWLPMAAIRASSAHSCRPDARTYPTINYERWIRFPSALQGYWTKGEVVAPCRRLKPRLYRDLHRSVSLDQILHKDQPSKCFRCLELSENKNCGCGGLNGFWYRCLCQTCSSRR
jgi:hypothetical protein